VAWSVPESFGFVCTRRTGMTEECRGTTRLCGATSGEEPWWVSVSSVTVARNPQMLDHHYTAWYGLWSVVDHRASLRGRITLRVYSLGDALFDVTDVTHTVMVASLWKHLLTYAVRVRLGHPPSQPLKERRKVDGPATDVSTAGCSRLCHGQPPHHACNGNRYQCLPVLQHLAQ
jgi:hypothetical protein